MNNNKNMNPVFSLKNFRSFGKDGADFELAPITVLTGCNSAGKSSLVKALMLLSAKNTDGYLGDIHFSSKLNISSKELSLGGYKSVAHGDGVISMSYRIWSADLQEELIVKREFHANRFDALDNGTLSYLEVEKIDGTIILQMEFNTPDNSLSSIDRNLDAVKFEFDRFFAVGCYMYFKESLLRLLEHKEKREQSGDTKQIKRSEEIFNIVKDRLETAGVTESEAAILWKYFNHNTWKSVIGATKLFDEKFISISDIEKEPKGDDLELMLYTFIELIVNDACSPFFTQTIEYINSTSAQIARLYSVEDNNKMCNALRELNSRNIHFHGELQPENFNHKPGSFLNKWVKKFGIGESIEVKGTEEGLGLMVYLNKEKERRLLADEGYGITQLVALLLQIDNCIPITLAPNFYSYVNERKVVYNFEPKTICVEEPEVHLHPKYQSLLAEMFVEAYQKYNIHFIIETHSEYLIRKLQVLVANKCIKSNDVSLNYVEKNEEGVSYNRQIRIQDNGRLDGSFGEGFYDEAGGLSRQLFMLND